jgi:hypothetical protein
MLSIIISGFTSIRSTISLISRFAIIINPLVVVEHLVNLFNRTSDSYTPIHHSNPLIIITTRVIILDV